MVKIAVENVKVDLGWECSAKERILEELMLSIFIYSLGLMLSLSFGSYYGLSVASNVYSLVFMPLFLWGLTLVYSKVYWFVFSNLGLAAYELYIFMCRVEMVNKYRARVSSFVVMHSGERKEMKALKQKAIIQLDG